MQRGPPPTAEDHSGWDGGCHLRLAVGSGGLRTASLWKLPARVATMLHPADRARPTIWVKRYTTSAMKSISFSSVR